MPSKQPSSPLLASTLLDQTRLQVFDSEDPDEVRDKVGRTFKPHSFNQLKHGSDLHSRMHQFAFGKVSAHLLRYGGEVDVDPERLEDFFLVQMPVSGWAEISCNGDSILTDSRRGVIISPTQRVEMRYREDCDQLMLRIDRADLEQVCSRHLGHPLREPLEFSNAFNWQQITAWQQVLQFLAQMQQTSADTLQHPLIVRQLEELVINTLLSQQANNYSDQLSGDSRCLAPRHVKRVEEYIQEHAAEALTPSQLAEVGGVSVRTLYAGFQEFRQIGPIEYLRNIRLHKVREALQEPDQQQSVTDTAMAWGFSHMGRFSKAYQQLFGEKPSDTLRKAQA